MSRRLTVTLLATLAALVVAPAFGEDPPAGKTPVPDAKKDGKTDERPRIERAKDLVKELELALAEAKTAAPVDPELVTKLESAIAKAKELTKPITLAELTDDEKAKLVEEARKEPGGAAGGNPMAGALDGVLGRAFEGADLSEEEEVGARTVLSEWWRDTLASTGDSKKASDLKRDRDEKLTKLLGKKKAQKVINNVNSMGPGRR